MKFKLLLNVLFGTAVAFDVDNLMDVFIAQRVWIAGSLFESELWSLISQKYSAIFIMEYALRSKWTIPKPRLSRRFTSFSYESDR